MSTPIIMPKFGMAQEEGTIIRWVKQAGDAVEKGETLLEVQTDKIDMEVEAPVAGILGDIRFGPDATVPVATVIATVFAAGEAAGAQTAPPAAAAMAPPLAPRPSPLAQRMANAEGVDLHQVTGSGRQGRITKADVAGALGRMPVTPPGVLPEHRPRATPAARRLAREQGLQLVEVAGSGPQGRIQVADVIDYAQAPPRVASETTSPEPMPVPALPANTAPLRGMRRTIAARLTAAWRAIPHIFLTTSIDLTQAEAVRSRLAAEVAQAGGRLTPTVLLARATATALTRHPRLNAWLRAEGEQWVLTTPPAVDLGIAVALDEGLVVPVVRNAAQLGLAALAAQIADLAGRARAGELHPDEVTGGTFTISNLGMYPVDRFTAIINPPQVAILSVGRAQVQPVWDGQAFQPKPVVEVTLSADHRAVDGAVAAAFLAELKALVEEPVRMLV